MIRSADQAYYEMMKRGSASCARPPRSRPTSRSRSSSRAAPTTMKHNRRDRASAGSRTPRPHGIRDQGMDPASGSTDMANVSWVVPDDPPGPLDHGPADRRATRSSSATPPPGRPPIATTLLAATLVAQTAIDLLFDPALVEAAWREFKASTGRADRDRPPSAPAARGTMPRRAPLDGGPEPAAPRLRRRRAKCPPSRRPSSPEDLVADRPHDPGRRRLRGAQRLGPRVRDVRRLRPPDLRRAADVHEAAVDHRPGGAAPRARSTSRSSARRSTTP